MLEEGAGAGPAVLADEGGRLAGDVAAERLDLDDLGAQVSQGPSAQRGREELAPLDDGHAVQESDVGAQGLG
jgi:hypothetical protein